MSTVFHFSSELLKIANVIGRRSAGGGEIIQSKPKPAPAPKPKKPAKEPGTGKIHVPKDPGQYGYLTGPEVQRIMADRKKAGRGLGTIDTSKPGAKPVAIMSPGGPGPDNRTGFRPPPAVAARRARVAAAARERASEGDTPPTSPSDPKPDVKMTRFNETATQRGNRLKMQQDDPDRWNRLKAEHRVRTSPVVKATEQLSGKGQVFAPDPEGRFVTPQPKPKPPNVGAPTVPSVVAKPAQQLSAGGISPERMAKLKAEMDARDKALAAKNRQSPGYAAWKSKVQENMRRRAKERGIAMDNLRSGKTHSLHSNRGNAVVSQLQRANIPLDQFNFYFLPRTGSYTAVRKGQKPPRNSELRTVDQMTAVKGGGGL